MVILCSSGKHIRARKTYGASFLGENHHTTRHYYLIFRNTRILEYWYSRVRGWIHEHKTLSEKRKPMAPGDGCITWNYQRDLTGNNDGSQRRYPPTPPLRRNFFTSSSNTEHQSVILRYANCFFFSFCFNFVKKVDYMAIKLDKRSECSTWRRGTHSSNDKFEQWSMVTQGVFISSSNINVSYPSLMIFVI